MLGLFGTLAASGKAGGAGPVDYLRAGLQDFSVRRFGAADVADRIGLSSLFFRDVPVAGAAALGSLEAAAGGDRLRTVHVAQRAIAGHGEADLTLRLGDSAGLFEGHLGFHSQGFYVDRPSFKEAPKLQPKAFLFKAGLVHLPPRYTLGVEGGSFLALRAEARALPFTLKALFNDPEQLALFPFATNAFSFQLGLSSIGWGS